MGFRINTNIAAMNAHRNATQTNISLDKSLQSLSSGLRINNASDDAAGMTIADSLRTQANGLGQAIANANDGIGVVQTADGALAEYISIVDSIRTKSIQAASDGQSTQSRAAIQADIERLLEASQNIAATTSFNGQSLLNGGYENKAFHIGAYSGETVNITIGDAQTHKVAEFAMIDGTVDVGTGAVTTSLTAQVTLDDGVTTKTAATFALDITTSTTGSTSLQNAQALVDGFNAHSQVNDSGIRASVIELAVPGTYSVRLDSEFDITTAADLGGAPVNKSYLNSLKTIDVTTRENAEKAIIIADYALKDLDATRSDIGSVQGQLSSTIRNISVTQVNVQAAESQIRDVDFAAESANFSKHNILAQSGSYAMAQANAVQQNVLSLLQ